MSSLNIEFKEWNQDWLVCALNVVWMGYDRLIQRSQRRGESLQSKNEKRITPLLVMCMQQERDFLPSQFKLLNFQPEYPEWETSRTGNPRSYDIGFIIGDAEEAVFSLEAKSIERTTKANIEGKDKYIDGVNKYLNGTYAPLSTEGGMLGYLHDGKLNELFGLIETSLDIKLLHYTPFHRRPHKTSNHLRKLSNIEYVRDFTCHHLIMVLI